MAQACPINFTSVDNTIGRLSSLFSAGVVSLFLLTGTSLWLFLLGTDLMIRLYGNKQFSLIDQTSKIIKRFFRLPTRTVDGAAKNVAGHFGLLFIVLMIAASFLGLTYTLDAIAGTYLFCLLLDVFFSFCVGCKVYHIYRLFAGAV